METEIWPNLFFECEARGIPVIVANGRLSEKSLRGYGPNRPLARSALASARYVAAQSITDAARLHDLGADPDRLGVVGNLKYDMAVPPQLRDEAQALRAAWGAGRPVWIAASTHEDEEAATVGMHRRLRERFPGLLLLWAPRHPERFRVVAETARSAGWQVSTRSRARWPQPGDDVFVIDTLGELMSFYACADVAFVGGSLQAIGGHNLLEPAATGTPIVTGPHLHNFVEIAQRLEDAGALRIGLDADAVEAAVERLLDDPIERAQMIDAGRALVELGRGALARTMALLQPALPPLGP
jgi:3-deoxy-D-manno-octulosonic-acid transferase